MKKIILASMICLALVGCDNSLKEANKAYASGNYAEALTLYAKAADKGDSEAQYRLGLFYADPATKEVDYDKVFKYLKLSANNGNALARLKICMIFDDSEDDHKLREVRDCEKAFSEVETLADKGNAEAQYEIANAYLGYGFSGAHNVNKAIKYFKLAADNGNQKALFDLWDIYSRYDEVKNDEKAKEYLDIIKTQNKPIAQLLVANEYYRDYNNPDPTKEDDFEYQLGISYARMDADEFYKLSADNGNAEAQYKIGKLTYDEAEQDNDSQSDYYQKALKYFRLAAEQKNADAQYSLGVMYYNGEGVRQDKGTARSYFGEACDNGLQKGCDAYKN